MYYMRSVVYARISRDTEGTGLGVQRQLADCRQAASARGWDVVREYVDNDVSASRKKPRPEYERMMTDLTAGKADALIVWDVDRLTRTPRELEDVIDLADRHQLALVSIGGDIDLATPQGRMMARIKGTVARHEVEQMSRRHRRKALERAENGLPGSKVPYGWTRVYDALADGRRAPGHDVIREDQARVIREGTARVLRGESIRSIVTWLNEAEVPTPAGAPKWITSTVRRLLMRPTNAGLRVHRGEIVGKSTTEPIITEDEYYRVRSVLTDPSRRLSPGNRPKYLLTSLAVCGACGAKMTYTSGYRRKSGERSAPALGCHECTKVRRSMPFVDSIVEGVVLGRLQSPEVLASIPAVDQDQGERLRSRLGGLQGKLDEAADMFTAGTITGAQLTRITAQVRPELEAVQSSLADLTPASAVRSIAGPDAVAAWDAATIETKREIVDALMTVTILPVGPGRGRDPESIRIEWKA